MRFFLTRAFFCLASSFLLEKILTQTIQFILNGLIVRVALLHLTLEPLNPQKWFAYRNVQ